MPPSYAVKRFCSSVSVARASSLRTGARRSASLPFSSPLRMSRNVPASLPSRNATSGSISSDEPACWRSSRSAATARRAGSRIRSRAGCRRPARSARDACCASSSSALLPALSASRPLASDVRLVSLASSRSAAVSTRSQRCLTSSSSLTRRLVLRDVEADARARCRRSSSASRSALNRSRLSLTAANAVGLALRRQRAAAREPLRQHLHFRRGRGGRRALRRLAVVEEHHQRREHEERDHQHAERLELLDHGQVADQRQLPRHRIMLGGRGAQLLHDRHRCERVVARLRSGPS